jgi:putative membrane protein
MNHVIPFLKGILIGTADVIPGVSGGTMALILGIYERFIGAISIWTKKQTWQYLLTGNWQKLWQQIDGGFILPIGLGIIVAGLTMAGIMSHLLETQPLHVWSLFFGLVAASAVYVGTQVRHWNLSKVVLLIVSAIESWLLLGLIPTETPTTFLFLFIAGLIAICGMLLPGISGSFILVLLGKYQFILDAVHQREFGKLIPVLLGIIVGLLCFSRILKYMLRKHHDCTLTMMIGLLLGSLRVLWPGEHLTADPSSSGWMLVMMGVGVVLVLGLERIGKGKEG